MKDVSFTAKQGEVTALVGPSGGGKTTVSRLAARFWDVSRGKITVGGMDISKIDPEALLSLFSIVFQDVTLFDNTILENIRIGNKDATDEQVLAAAKLANVDEFAEKLPDGWHTNIGENGCELSGGERQRISIARAFLKNAPIILLDEATASLDVENETLIQTALSRLIADKTVLVIAHRMRTVAGADKIVVLSEGTVAEEGAPETLLKQNGLYARMVKLQTESQKLEAGVKSLFLPVLLSAASAINLKSEECHHGLQTAMMVFFCENTYKNTLQNVTTNREDIFLNFSMLNPRKNPVKNEMTIRRIFLCLSSATIPSKNVRIYERYFESISNLFSKGGVILLSKCTDK